MKNSRFQVKNEGWLHLWTWTQSDRRGFWPSGSRRNSLLFLLQLAAVRTKDQAMPAKKEWASYLAWKVKLPHFAMIIRLSIFSPQDLCDSRGTLLAWQELITVLIKVTFQIKAQKGKLLMCSTPEGLGGGWLGLYVEKNVFGSQLGCFQWKTQECHNMKY